MENEPQDAYMPGNETEALEPFDVREQNSRRGMAMLGAIVLGLILLAFVILKLFAAGTRDRDDTPRILADNRPYKEIPLDRGGVQTPNQDKEVYDKLSGAGTASDVTLTNPSEKPMPKPDVKKPAANIVIKSPGATKLVETKPLAKPQAKPKPKPAPKPTAKPAASAGSHVVQIASLRSQAEAEAMWGRLKIKMGGTILPSHYADIKRVNLETKGIYYRLRIAGVGDKAAAQRLCERLKAQSQDCFVAAR